MSRGIPVRRISVFGADPSRESALMEEANADHARRTALTAFGPFTVTTLKTSAYPAKPWEVVRCDPTAAGFPVFLPDANAADSGNIIIKNDSASANTITIAPLNSTCRVEGAASVTIAAARGVIQLCPDAASNTWMRIN